ncbi:MAG TPA: TetR/AcrR family transcriptional regulator [Solirubrobacteraceae bacterium]|nr:TetR/AcrR family transcriptional regulator [Solirubrobacteraceae bacterium]
MSPRPKVDHLRRPQIIKAAAEVLYERGLFDTRIGDIAERAGTSAATILYWFESKDRLLEEAVAYADHTFYDRLSAGQGRITRASDRLVYLIEETSLGPGGLNDYTLWMEIWVRARRDASVRSSYFGLDRRQRELIAQIVREGQRDGEFAGEADPDDVALSLSGLLDGLGVQVTLGQPDVSPQRMVDVGVAMASQALGCELRPSKPVQPPRKGHHAVAKR